MKLQSKTQIQPELSSIKSLGSEHENTQSDVELEEIDIAKMNFYDYYTQTDVIKTQLMQYEGEKYISDILKKMLTNIQKQIVENEIMRKIPILATQTCFEMLSIPLNQVFQTNEDPTRDIETGGLAEDTEPSEIFKEQWLTAKVNLEGRLADQNETSRPSVSQMTFMRSKLMTAEQNVHRPKQVDPIQIDLTDPLDISVTEESLRAQKEKQVKEKQELREAENRRRLKEEKEEQLKYEMMAKDKKSKLYTYDYDGKLISVNLTKTHKLPSASTAIGSGFNEEMIGKVQTKKKMGTVSLPKRREDGEKEPTFKFQMVAPPVVENMNLQQGVAVDQDGRVREGPRPVTVELDNMNNPNLRMARNEYLSLTQQINTNRSQSSNIQIKAEDKVVRELDSKKGFNFEKLKRLQQLNAQQQMGGIKINSTKIFESLAQTIYEEEELPVIPQKRQSQTTVKNPMDTFNLSIYKNSNWGKDQVGQETTTLKLKGSRVREKDLMESIGAIPKRPRERVEVITLPKVKSSLALWHQ